MDGTTTAGPSCEYGTPRNDDRPVPRFAHRAAPGIPQPASARTAEQARAIAASLGLGLPVIARADGSYRVGLDDGACIVSLRPRRNIGDGIVIAHTQDEFSRTRGPRHDATATTGTLGPQPEWPDTSSLGPSRVGSFGAADAGPGLPPPPRSLELRDSLGDHPRQAPHIHARVLVDGGTHDTATMSTHLRMLGVGRVLDGAYAAEAAELALEDPGAPGVDAVLLLGAGPTDPDRGIGWRRRGIPHLGVDLRADQAIVGPLVVPGVSSCLSCHELSRVDRDPTWPLLAARQRGPGVGVSSTPRSSPTVVLLASALAAVILVEALDGDVSMAGVSTEVSTALGLIHRHWPRHPRCACQRGARDRADTRDDTARGPACPGLSREPPTMEG